MTNTEPTTPILSADDLDTATTQYMITALWSSHDTREGEDEPRPLDDDHDVSDIADESVVAARAAVVDFVERAGAEDIRAYLSAFAFDAGQLGHDLWLTRNHHGVGFWDRGLGALGDRLTDIAHVFGEVDAYVGDDGMIYTDTERDR